MAAALAFDHRRVAHQRRETGAVERRRHGEQAEVGPQRALRVERQRQAEIAVEAALVDLVEQHGGDAGQLGIGLDALQEDALGEDEDPGARRAPAVEPRGIADRLADRLAGQLRHPLGRGARREPARRQQQDLAAAPGLAEQGGRDRRGLARAGRRDQDRARAVAQRGLRSGKTEWMGSPVTPAPRFRPSISAGDRELHRLDQGGLGAAGGKGPSASIARWP